MRFRIVVAILGVVIGVCMVAASVVLCLQNPLFLILEPDGFWTENTYGMSIGESLVWAGILFWVGCIIGFVSLSRLIRTLISARKDQRPPVADAPGSPTTTDN
jgi:hypothetical protein